MKNVSHKIGWNLGTNPEHVEPLPILIIKEMYNGKSDKDFVELKLCGYHMSSTLDPYEFNISFFDHGNMEEFLLFIRKFNMILTATGTLETETKIHYL